MSSVRTARPGLVGLRVFGSFAARFKRATSRACTASRFRASKRYTRLTTTSTPSVGPSFQALQHRASERHAVVYCVFDLLALNGKDMTREPLETHHVALSNVVKGTSILLSDPLPSARLADVARPERF
jgi:hypothetical protein